MSRIIFQVALGKWGESLLYKECIESVSFYAERLGCDHLILTEPRLRISPNPDRSNRSAEASEKHGGILPHFEKFFALNLLDSFDQVLVVDADVYIRDCAPNIFLESQPDEDVLAVSEAAMPLKREVRKQVKEYAQSQFGDLYSPTWGTKRRGVIDFYNSGIVLLQRGRMLSNNKPDPVSLLTSEIAQPFVDGIGNWKWSGDQTFFNYWVRSSGLKHRDLSWRWNGLYGGIRPSRIAKAHFVHFYRAEKYGYIGSNQSALSVLRDVWPRSFRSKSRSVMPKWV